MLNEIKIVEYTISFIALYLTVFFLLLFLKNRNEVLTEVQNEKNWTPKISIVIPAYNEEKNVGRCIDSILNADYSKEKLEIIVVDDSSTDRTYEVAKEYEKYGVKVVKKEKEGTAAATKNYGVKLATGEIIATLDSDSYIRKDAIKKMLKLFNSEDIAAVTAAIKADEERGTNILTNIQKVEYLFTLFSRKVSTFIDAVQVTPGPFSMFRSWVFDKIGYFDPTNILEDQEFAMRIQKNNYRIRSSLEAEVYTEVPKGFSALLKQRIRWHRGGLHNSIKYLNMIGPHYGDFGLIVMPLSLLAVIAIFAVIIISTIYFVATPSYAVYLGYFEVFILNFSPIYVIGLAIMLLNIIWIGWGVSLFKKEKISPFLIFIYIIAYSYLITIYWIAAIIKELKNEKMSW